MINNNGSPLVELFHSCTPEANKNSILESFQQEHGAVRLLIATIAFGVGVDCKGVKTIIHYGPSKKLNHMYKRLVVLVETVVNVLLFYLSWCFAEPCTFQHKEFY